MLHQLTDGLEERLRRGPISAYVGFDPTADSLHAGHLIPVFGLAHLQRAGGRPVALVGGGTGMIGDPSGRSAERNLLDEATLDANATAIREQLARFLDFSPGPSGAVMLDNREWLGRYGLLEYLREIGKYFSLGYMLAKDSVQLRLQGGISFTEFSYMTLQATDFLHLYREHGVELQMGGADQWGNITAGLELIRRIEGRVEGDEPRAHALSFPLLTAPSGAKFGKTEQGTIFLSAARTTPYAFYQYWLNTDDRDVGLYLRFLTMLGRLEIEGLEAEQTSHPEHRPAQRALALDLTERIHGRDEAMLQVRVAEAAFGDAVPQDPGVLAVLYDNLERFEFDRSVATILDLALASEAFTSRSDLRRVVQQGGLRVDGERVGDPAEAPPVPLAGGYHVLRVGKRRLIVGRLRTE